MNVFATSSSHAAFAVAMLVASAAPPATASESPLRDLKGAYLACERAAAAGKQGDDDVMRCSILYEDLKRSAFGGDFRLMRTWYESERVDLSSVASQ